MADFLGLMKQAAELKSKMEAMQAELEASEVEGVAGGGMVAVRLNGKGDLAACASTTRCSSLRRREILEDLLVAAHADARRKVEALMQEKMQSVTGGLPLPPGLKLFSAWLVLRSPAERVHTAEELGLLAISFISDRCRRAGAGLAGADR